MRIAEYLGSTRQRRTLALALPLSLLFLFFGQVAAPWIVGYLGRIDISTDGVLRAVSAERVASRDGVPVTLVDIDAQTWKLWGDPAATPRAGLANILANLLRPGSGSSPLAIVLDIDLGTRQEPDALFSFLEQYPADAPPVVFPKRLEVGTDGARRPVPGPYDAVFQGRDNLVWADAMLDSDDDGVVRHWSLWREVCTDGGTEILPSIPARLAALVGTADGDALLPRPDPPRLTGDCRAAAGERHQPRILVTSVAGLRGVAGRGTTIMTPRFASIPARLVADSDAHFDDAALFGGRVVFIGASHPASRDFHRTAYGNLPGVEILAQQVYLAPLSGLRGASYGWGFRLATLALFALLVAVDLVMKRFRIMTQLVILVTLAAGAIRWFGTFTVFEVIIVAISLLIVLAGTREIWEMVREWFATPNKKDYFFS